jgi:hypothetical protein
VIAFGINPATSTIYRVLRGEVLPYIPRRLAILPGARDRMVNLLRIAHEDWSAERAKALAENFCLNELPDSAVVSGSSLPPDWDSTDWPALAENTVGAARDLEYLRWRYLDHPRFEYRIVTVGEGRRTGVLVWRMETIRQATPQGRQDVDRIGRILELLPASPENASQLIAAGLQQMCAEGAFAADFYGYHAGTNCCLEKAGFVDTGKVPDAGHVPSRFQPLDGKGAGILSAMFLQERSPGFNDAASPWYWTKSDSDQDRPN